MEIRPASARLTDFVGLCRNIHCKQTRTEVREHDADTALCPNLVLALALVCSCCMYCQPQKFDVPAVHGGVMQNCIAAARHG